VRSTAPCAALHHARAALPARARAGAEGALVPAHVAAEGRRRGRIGDPGLDAHGARVAQGCTQPAGEHLRRPVRRRTLGHAGRIGQAQHQRRQAEDRGHALAVRGVQAVEQHHDVGDALHQLHAVAAVDQAVALDQVDRRAQQLGHEQATGQHKQQAAEQRARQPALPALGMRGGRRVGGHVSPSSAAYRRRSPKGTAACLGRPGAARLIAVPCRPRR
jgi:hypothetical protein